MTGGCCCSVKRRDSAVIGFAAMNIALYAALLLICMKELDDECQSLTKGSCSVRYINFHLFDVHFFFSCIIGIIAGILLLFAVTTKNKSLFWTWIILKCILLQVLFAIFPWLGVDQLRDKGRINSSSLLYLLCFPFFIWSLVAVIMSMSDILSGNVEDQQQGLILGQFQPLSNQQMPPQNPNGAYPYQPQYGNNTVLPQLTAPPGGPPQPLPSAPPDIPK